jgi:hypothetical protein
MSEMVWEGRGEVAYRPSVVKEVLRSGMAET